MYKKVISIAVEAGQAILEIYNAYANGSAEAAAIQTKDDQSPLTKADLASHELISQRLAALTPDIPVVSEEDTASDLYRKPIGRFLRVVASKSHINHETQTFIDRLGEVDLVQAGSSLKLCRIAEGAADIYPRLGPTCEWDTAAAQAVVEGAGGVVHDLHGQPLHYGKPDLLNPSFIVSARVCLVKSDD